MNRLLSARWPSATIKMVFGGVIENTLLGFLLLSQSQLQKRMQSSNHHQNKQLVENQMQPAVVITEVQAAAIRSSTPLTSSFYRRDLPTETCTALSSPKGKKLFASSMQRNGLASFFPLMEQHLTQSEPSFCGLTTLVIALNAMSIDPRRTWKGPWRWYEEGMLNCCVDIEEVKSTGITLFVFKCLASCQGLDANIDFADASSDTFENRFRKAVIEVCIEKESGHGNDGHECNSENEDCAEYLNSPQNLEKVLIVSYNRRVLKQTGTGHFSPIIAYDPASDSVLIMDTARFKYGAHWVQLKLLAKSMECIDPDSGRSRGFVTLQQSPIAVNGKQETTTDLPVSILLLSEMKDNNARKTIKLLVQEQKLKSGLTNVTFSDVALMSTVDGTNPNFMWDVVKPNFLPVGQDKEAKELIDDIRILLKAIMAIDKDVIEFRNIHPDIFGGQYDCREACNRTIKMDREEAIYILFLACLDKSEREKIVFNPAIEFDEKQINSVRHQLLAEAELLRRAIDFSDQFDDGTLELKH